MRLDGDNGSYTRGEPLWRPSGEADLYRIVGEPLLYKHYKTSKRAAAEIERLQRVVATGRRLAEEVRPEHPARRLNLPIDLVRNRQRTTIAGVVLPLAPRRFMDGAKVRELSHLYFRRANPPQAQVRLAVAIALAEALARLHTAGMVHGDISGGNVLWAHDDPVTGAYLIDCDGVFPRAQQEPVNRFTRLWEDPRLATGKIHAHDRSSDDYALALALWRVLTLSADREGQDDRYEHAVVPAEVPMNVPAATRALLTDCFAHPLDTATRATAGVLAQTLRDDFFPAGRPDLAVLRRIDDPSVPAPVRPAPRRPRETPHEPRPRAARKPATAAPYPSAVRPRPSTPRPPTPRPLSPPQRRRSGRWLAALAVPAIILTLVFGVHGAPSDSATPIAPKSGSAAKGGSRGGTLGATASHKKKSRSKTKKHSSSRRTHHKAAARPNSHRSTSATTTRRSGTGGSRPAQPHSTVAAKPPPTPVSRNSGSSGLSGSAHSGGGSGGLSGSAGAGGSGGGGSGGLSGSAGAVGSGGGGSGGLSGSAGSGK